MPPLLHFSILLLLSTSFGWSNCSSKHSILNRAPQSTHLNMFAGFRCNSFGYAVIHKRIRYICLHHLLQLVVCKNLIMSSIWGFLCFRLTLTRVMPSYRMNKFLPYPQNKADDVQSRESSQNSKHGPSSRSQISLVMLYLCFTSSEASPIYIHKIPYLFHSKFHHVVLSFIYFHWNSINQMFSSITLFFAIYVWSNDRLGCPVLVVVVCLVAFYCCHYSER
jgi:hypothetical protein